MDLEQGIKLTGFTNDEPPEIVLDKKNEIGSGYVTKWSEGSHGPWAAPYHTAMLGEFEESQKQKVIEDPTMENVNGTGNVGKWSEGFRDPSTPNLKKPEKAKVISAKTKPVPGSEPDISGLWPSSFSKEYCCIYRVPNRLRRVNPEAYTPQMLLLGPLQHSKKAEALELSKTDLRYVLFFIKVRTYIHISSYIKPLLCVCTRAYLCLITFIC